VAGAVIADAGMNSFTPLAAWCRGLVKRFSSVRVWSIFAAVGRRTLGPWLRLDAIVAISSPGVVLMVGGAA